MIHNVDLQTCKRCHDHHLLFDTDIMIVKFPTQYSPYPESI